MSIYYENCAIPKPESRKKKKLCNGYKDKPNRHCMYCGKAYAERHEIFPGPNRKISMLNELQIDVCPEHHREIQANITPWAQGENKRLKQTSQREFMDKLIRNGMHEEDALQTWMVLIGRNYIEGCDPK